jgi:hypothetical protein
MNAAMKDATKPSHEAPATTSFYHHPEPFSTGACYYLVDQAKHSDVLRLLFDYDPSPVYDLPYIHSQYREQALDGPVVIKPTTNQSEKWLNNWLAEAKALALHGPLLTLEEIRDHLISLNTVRTPHGDSLFRYSDTATLGSLGASLTHHQRLRILGPLTAIHGCYTGTRWSLSKSWPSSRPNESTTQNPLPLEVTQKNLASVEVYRRDLLSRGLADNNKVGAKTVACWFQQLTTFGAPSEQGLVEGAGLLIAQGFTSALSETELATVRKTRQGACWSDALDALAILTHSQDGI